MNTQHLQNIAKFHNILIKASTFTRMYVLIVGSNQNSHYFKVSYCNVHLCMRVNENKKKGSF